MTGLPHIYICPAEWPGQGVSEGLVRSKNDQQSVIWEWKSTFQLTTISSSNRHTAKVKNMIWVSQRVFRSGVFKITLIGTDFDQFLQICHFFCNSEILIQVFAPKVYNSDIVSPNFGKLHTDDQLVGKDKRGG